MNAKATQILEGARDAFLEHGFDGASMGEITRRAGVSKGTIYAHFKDKTDLFLAVVRYEMTRFSDRVFESDRVDGTLRDALLRVGQHFLHRVVDKHSCRIFRLCIAESERVPQVGMAFWDHGLSHGAGIVARMLAVGRDRGEVDIEDLERAAHQFFELTKAGVFYRVLLDPNFEMSSSDVDRTVERAVDDFLRMYRTP